MTSHCCFLSSTQYRQTDELLNRIVPNFCKCFIEDVLCITVDTTQPWDAEGWTWTSRWTYKSV